MEGDKEINAIREFLLSTEGQFKPIVEDEGVSKQRNSDSSITRLIKDEQKITFYSDCDDNEYIHQTISENSGSFSTSDTKFHDGQKTTRHSNYGENVSSDCMMALSPLSSTIHEVPNVELITIDSSDDENYDNNNTTVRGSSSLSSSVSKVPTVELIILDSSDDEKASIDCIADGYSSSTSGNSAYTKSYQPAPYYYREESVFECVHCDSSFSEPCDLFFHTKIHGKPYICKRCSRSYIDGSGFINHIERHARIGGIPFSCPICNQGFCQKHILNQHIMLYHKD